MEIVTSNYLQSTAYRCLFEGVKKEGAEPFIELFNDIKDIPDKETLILQTIFEGCNDLDKLWEKNKDILKYFKEHKDELNSLKIVKNNDALKVLDILKADKYLLNLYLNNARILEELKVYAIHFTNLNEFIDFDNKKYCEIYRDDVGNIINITKYFTDGEIVTTGNECDIDENFNYSRINFSLNPNSRVTYLFDARNGEDYRQYRRIYIENFGFDASRLPSEEDIESYEIPKEFIKK